MAESQNVPKVTLDLRYVHVYISTRSTYLSGIRAAAIFLSEHEVRAHDATSSYDSGLPRSTVDLLIYIAVIHFVNIATAVLLVESLQHMQESKTRYKYIEHYMMT